MNDGDDELFFAKWLNDERHSALFPFGTIVGDSQRRKSPTSRRQDFEPAFRLW